MSVTPQEFHNEWKNGDRERAKQMAREYVQAHYAELAPQYESKSMEDLVHLVSFYRRNNEEEKRIITDMWLLANYEPRNISGVIAVGATQELINEIQANLKERRNG